MLHEDTFPLASQLSYAEGKPALDETPEPLFPAPTRERFVKTRKDMWWLLSSSSDYEEGLSLFNRKGIISILELGGERRVPRDSGHCKAISSGFFSFSASATCKRHSLGLLLSDLTALCTQTGFFLSYA